jgi:hypothetical protein
MKRLYLVPILLLLAVGAIGAVIEVPTAPAFMSLPIVGGGVEEGSGCTYTVEWSMTSTTVECPGGTDSNSATTNGVTPGASGIEFDNNADYAYIQFTDGQSIDQESFTLRFKYQETGSSGNYSKLFDHDSSAHEFAAMLDTTSNNYNILIYLNNVNKTLTSTVDLRDGSEHSVEIVYERFGNSLSLSIDGETPVSIGCNELMDLSSGNLYFGHDISYGGAGVKGIISDFEVE